MRVRRMREGSRETERGNTGWNERWKWRDIWRTAESEKRKHVEALAFAQLRTVPISPSHSGKGNSIWNEETEGEYERWKSPTSSLTFSSYRNSYSYYQTLPISRFYLIKFQIRSSKFRISNISCSVRIFIIHISPGTLIIAVRHKSPCNEARRLKGKWAGKRNKRGGTQNPEIDRIITLNELVPVFVGVRTLVNSLIDFRNWGGKGRRVAATQNPPRSAVTLSGSNGGIHSPSLQNSSPWSGLGWDWDWFDSIRFESSRVESSRVAALRQSLAILSI